MRNATSGTHCPNGTASWPVITQAIAAGAQTTITAASPGARAGAGPILASPNAILPQTAAGAAPNLYAYVSANDVITIVISNPSAAALVATAAAITFDVIQFPPVP